MPKEHEVDYVRKLARVLAVPIEDVERHLMEKPFGDPGCWRYLMDISQIMQLLPPAPARILDLGCGSGWTSEMFARSKYSVLGTDISSDMIALARRRIMPGLDLDFCVHDWESEHGHTGFDGAVVYDALHHSTNERAVIANAHESLRDGGTLITVEPGNGQSTAPDSVAAMERFGTTERDMPFETQADAMKAAGFRVVRQYGRLSMLVLEDLQTRGGPDRQREQLQGLIEGARRRGLTSVVVGVK